MDKVEDRAAHYVDITKAISSVDHYILLDNMFPAGIRETPLNRCSTYLADRKQRVKVDDVFCYES